MALLSYGLPGSSSIGGVLSFKNQGLGATADLGIGQGDALAQQLKDQEDERKKKQKLLQMQRNQYPDYMGSAPGAASMLFGTGGA